VESPKGETEKQFQTRVISKYEPENIGGGSYPVKTKEAVAVLRNKSPEAA